MRKPCCDKQGTNKGAWSKQEDQKLIDYIRTHGEGCWRSLPVAAGLHRCGKSCRLRWINYLRPDLKRGNFGQDEEDLIIKLHSLLGNRWSLIAGRLPGRTDNEVKNYWNSHIKRKLVKLGIDPNNHRINFTLPKSSPKKCESGSVTSSETMNNDDHTSKNPAEKSSGVAANDHHDGCDDGNNNNNNYERCVSDTTSLIEDLTTPGSLNLDLNLDLTIAIPACPHSDSPTPVETKKPETSGWADITKEADHHGSDTLMLFT